MKTNFFTIGLLAFLIISCEKKKEPENVAEIEVAKMDELGRMNRDFAKALVKGDAAAAANEYDENAVLYPPNEAPITGRGDIQKYWQGAIDAGIIDCNVSTIAAERDGELAYEIGSFVLKMKGEKPGDTIVDKGRYTVILKRNAEGKWIATSDMWQWIQPAPAK